MWQNSIDAAALTSAFRRQLELSNYIKGETVVFLTDPGTDRRSIDAGFAAANELGAVAYEVRVGGGTDDRLMQSDPLSAPGVAEAVAQADLIFVFYVAFFSKWESAARRAGARILNVLDAPEQLVRIQSQPELKPVAVAGRERLEKATRMQVLSDAGTDFSVEIDKTLPILGLYGFADEPGTMTMWGQGMTAFFPIDGSAQGRLVVQPGDVWSLPYTRMVQSRIDIEVRDGFVRSVEGSVDAFAFRSWLDKGKVSEDDLDPYAVSHLGWGLNPRASWDDILLYETRADLLTSPMRSYPGNFLFSTGPGPTRKTRGHIDLPMNHCTILLDDEVIIEQGRIVAENMIVDSARTSH